MLAGRFRKNARVSTAGIFNMFIVIPMIIQIFTLPLLYHSVLGLIQRMMIRLAGVLLLCAALSVSCQVSSARKMMLPGAVFVLESL